MMFALHSCRFTISTILIFMRSTSKVAQRSFLSALTCPVRWFWDIPTHCPDQCLLMILFTRQRIPRLPVLSALVLLLYGRRSYTIDVFATTSERESQRVYC